MTKKTMDFFTDPSSSFKRTLKDDGAGLRCCPDVMERFQNDVLKADALVERYYVPV